MIPDFMLKNYPTNKFRLRLQKRFLRQPAIIVQRAYEVHFVKYGDYVRGDLTIDRTELHWYDIDVNDIASLQEFTLGDNNV